MSGTYAATEFCQAPPVHHSCKKTLILIKSYKLGRNLKHSTPALRNPYLIKKPKQLSYREILQNCHHRVKIFLALD